MDILGQAATDRYPDHGRNQNPFFQELLFSSQVFRLLLNQFDHFEQGGEDLFSWEVAKAGAVDGFTHHDSEGGGTGGK
jgi:hypothetical protein